MTAFTCAKCARRFTPAAEELQAALSASQGQKHAQVICPHCGKGNKVAPERLKQAARFSPSMPAAPAAPAALETPTALETPAEPTESEAQETIP
ncbi:MAG: hypothetical protein QG637_325 [Chloroflexota bacterium]|nr:hypothetical protein [Chloroflexota bacterium]